MTVKLSSTSASRPFGRKPDRRRPCAAGQVRQDQPVNRGACARGRLPAGGLVAWPLRAVTQPAPLLQVAVALCPVQAPDVGGHGARLSARQVRGHHRISVIRLAATAQQRHRHEQLTGSRGLHGLVLAALPSAARCSRNEPISGTNGPASSGLRARTRTRPACPCPARKPRARCWQGPVHCGAGNYDVIPVPGSPRQSPGIMRGGDPCRCSRRTISCAVL
jgi:hypothetical protein